MENPRPKHIAPARERNLCGAGFQPAGAEARWFVINIRRLLYDASAMLTSRTDVLIIGAGPIGIELAVALKKAGVDYAQVDAGQIGSTIEWYAPQTHFFSSPERIAIAGVPLLTLDQTKATREEYLNYLRAVVLQFDLKIHTFERVTAIRPLSNGSWAAVSRSIRGERQWETERIVLAIGDMHHPRRLGIPGEDLPHVSHYFRDPHRYFRRDVLIAGGKNSAVEAAIRCVRIGARVTLSYRRGELDADRIKFWLMPEIRSMIREKRLQYHPSTVICEIGESETILERAGGGRFTLQPEEILLLTGYVQDSGLFEEIGIEMVGEARKPRFNERTMETNVAGVYVAGTAIAGTQLGGVTEFIETSHVHVDRIVAALTGVRNDVREAPQYDLPES